MRSHKIVFIGLAWSLVFAGQAFAPPTKPDPKAPPWELAKAKVDAARNTCQAIAQEYLDGKATVEQVHQWSQRWLNAQREVNSKKADLIAAAEAHVERMQQLEQAAKERQANRRGLISDVYAAEYHRLEAELNLSRTKSSR